MKRVWYGLLIAMIVLGMKEVVHLLHVGQIATNASDKVPWGIDVPAYIFLTGMSAGSFIVSSLGLFGMTRYKPIARIATVQAVILLMVAPVMLLFAMGHPERFWMIYAHPNPTSVISWGAYLLLIYPVVCVLYAYYQMRRDFKNVSLSEAEVIKDDRKARLFGLIGVPLAIMVHGYTGVLLGFIRGRVLWNTPLMPVLFLTSAIVSGIALLSIILLVLRKTSGYQIDQRTIVGLTQIMLVTLLFDLFFIGVEAMTSLYGRSGEHFEAWQSLLIGQFHLPFVWGEIVVGAIIPIILIVGVLRDVAKKEFALIMASLCVLFGVFVMRCNIILGGQIVQAYGGPPGHYIPRIGEWLVIFCFWAIGALLYTLAVNKLPLMPAIDREETI